MFSITMHEENSNLYIVFLLQSENFERVKASGLNDRKWVHISNMNPFPIV